MGAALLFPEYSTLREAVRLLTAENLLLAREARFTESKGVTVEARGAVLRAAAALLAYRASHATFPERLDQALPDARPDPFTGRPLPYRQEGDGFVVFSGGPDRNYAGGRPGEPKPTDQALFRYPATPVAGK